MILAHKDLGSPAAKKTTVQIPGSSIELDFTEAFGDVPYNRRTMSFVFLSLAPWSDNMAHDSAVKNAMHGQKVQIIVSDEPDVYFYGRINVGSWEYFKGAARCIITAECDPWKYSVSETVVTSAGDETVYLHNRRKWVSPKVSVDAPVTLVWEGHSVALSAGDDWTVAGLILQKELTEVEIQGTASVTFKYREAGL